MTSDVSEGSWPAAVQGSWGNGNPPRLGRWPLWTPSLAPSALQSPNAILGRWGGSQDVGLGWRPGPPWEGGFLHRPLRTSSRWGGGPMLGSGDQEQEAQAGGIQPGPQPPPRRLPWAQSRRNKSRCPWGRWEVRFSPPRPPYPAGAGPAPPGVHPDPLQSPAPSLSSAPTPSSVSLCLPTPLFFFHLCPEPSSSVEPTCPFLGVASADAAVIVFPLALSS